MSWKFFSVQYFFSSLGAHAVGSGAAAVFAGQEAALQRAVGDHANALVQADGFMLALEIGAPHQAVGRLRADEAVQVVFVADPHGFHQAPGGLVRAADVAHLAGSDQVVQRAQGFFLRRVVVRPVGLVQIDVIGLQALQAVIDRFHHMPAAQARRRSGPAHRRPLNLVASTIRWRLPRAFSQRPMIVSLSPPWLPGTQAE